VTETAIGLTWVPTKISARVPMNSANGMCPSTTRRSLLAALAIVCALVGPITVRAEDSSVPSAARPSRAASLPTPTVLRGTPLSTTRSVPICPPGYALSGYACIEPSGGGVTQGTPGYDSWSYYGYWPEYGNDNRYGGFAGRGFSADRFAGSHGDRVARLAARRLAARRDEG
jgi:hypothetical protein